MTSLKVALLAIGLACTWGCAASGSDSGSGGSGGKGGSASTGSGGKGGSGGSGGSSATGGDGGSSSSAGSGGSGGSAGSGTGGDGGSSPSTGGSGGSSSGDDAASTGGSGGSSSGDDAAGGSTGTDVDAAGTADAAPSSGGKHDVTADNALVKCPHNGYHLTGMASAADFCAFYETYCPYDPTGMMGNNGKPLNATNGTDPWFFKDYDDCVAKYSKATLTQQQCRAGQLCSTNFKMKPFAQGCTHATGHFDGACFK